MTVTTTIGSIGQWDHIVNKLQHDRRHLLPCMESMEAYLPKDIRTKYEIHLSPIPALLV